ncbi:hypothetical protein ZWY2020_043503, partial [Hordeum vulgare]
HFFKGINFSFVKFNTSFGDFVLLPQSEEPNLGKLISRFPTNPFESRPLSPPLVLFAMSQCLLGSRVQGRIISVVSRTVCTIILDATRAVTEVAGYFHGYQGRDILTEIHAGDCGHHAGVTKNLSVGTKGFWFGQQRKSGVVATGQIASTGLVSLSYVQKVFEKVSLATDFMYHHMSKYVTASVGYDYIMRHSRLRGKVDTNGTVSALLEERINQHATLVLSAEVDHWKKDNKFGIGINVGE